MKRDYSWSSLLALTSPPRRVLLFSFILLLLGAITSLLWIDRHIVTINVSTSTTTTQNLNITANSRTSHLQPLPSPSDHQTLQQSLQQPPRPPPPAVSTFTCPSRNHTLTSVCRSHPLSLHESNQNLSPSSSCPNYFRWIHEDLLPWKPRGITREMVERANRTANFRLVIKDGIAYVEHYRKSFQSRDIFTLWGILQLLRRYPGRVPDLDLMFDCVDWPVIRASRYRGRNKPAPPPLFRYCGDDATLDIVFPDWSFWGWPEINIKPWGKLLNDLEEGNKRIRWMDREPYAYWKGNPSVASTRQDLLKCNVSEDQDWNARLFAQDWLRESRKGFKESNLAYQCNYRYKIYIEGSTWSVSEKYILACDSLSLIVKPHYYDFFTRGLMPVHHYWPIRNDDKCQSIKFAVDWGNSHKQKAQAIGKEASTFTQEKLNMDHVYDYMFHLLSEYAKLLRYKPTIPAKAVELCSESMACPARGLVQKFMMESMVNEPHISMPCSLSPPYNAVELRQLESRKANSIKQVEMWEDRAEELRTQ